MSNAKTATQKIWIFTGIDRDESVALFETRYHKVEIDGADIKVLGFDRSAYFTAISNGDGTESLPTQHAKADIELLKDIDTWEQMRKEGRGNNPHEPVLLAAVKKQAIQVLGMHLEYANAPRIQQNDVAEPAPQMVAA